jgi:hypothetical protein
VYIYFLNNLDPSTWIFELITRTTSAQRSVCHLHCILLNALDNGTRIHYGFPDDSLFLAWNRTDAVVYKQTWRFFNWYTEFTSWRTENTLHPHYEDQPMMYRVTAAYYCKNHTEHVNKLRGLSTEYLNVEEGTKCKYNLTLWHSNATTVVVEKQ